MTEEAEAMISFEMTVLFNLIHSDLTKKLNRDLIGEYSPDKPLKTQSVYVLLDSLKIPNEQTGKTQIGE